MPSVKDIIDKYIVNVKQNESTDIMISQIKALVELSKELSVISAFVYSKAKE